jgi:O-antigen ligase
MGFSSIELVSKKYFYIGTLISLLFAIMAFYTDFYMLAIIPFIIVLSIWVLQDARFAFYGLILSIPLSITLNNDLDFPDEPLMLITSFVFLLFFILKTRHHHWRLWISHPLIKLCLISFCWLVITVIFSQNMILSLKFLAKKIWYLIPFLFSALIIFREKKSIFISFYLVFFPLLLMVIFVLYKYKSYDFRFEEVHAPMDPFFVNHVIYGSMVSIFIPAIVASLFLCKRFSMVWFTLLFGFLIFLIANYFSYSRAAWMAVIFSAGVYVMIRFKLMQYAILFLYAIVLSGVLLLANNNTFLSYKPNHDKTIMHEESIVDHVMATIQGTDISSAERYYRWIAGIRMSRDYPLFGVGPNNFVGYYKNYAIASFRTWVSRNPERSTTHNYFLFMLVEQGYPAMILYGILIFAIFMYGQRLYHRLIDKDEKIITMTIICMIGALFINNFFSELIETDKIGSLFYLGIAILVTLDLKNRQLLISERS